MPPLDPHSPFDNAISTSPCAKGPYKPLRPWALYDADARPAVEPKFGAPESGLFNRLKAATMRALSAFGR